MSSRVERATLSVDADLARFVEDEALVGTGIDADTLWHGLATLVADLGPRNAALLARRAELQTILDEWHRTHPWPIDQLEYEELLVGLGYLVPLGEPFEVETDRIDPELAHVAAPQLVVPATNARYALNAANARWGSLYDALYGTDALGDRPTPGPYDPARGRRVVAWVRGFLDDVAPLGSGSHADARRYHVVDGDVAVELADGSTTTFAPGTALVGHQGEPAAPTRLVVEHHELGIDLVIDRDHPVGRDDPAGVADVRLEAALTTIVDCEDSVATVDGADKALAYRNWLGLLRGDLVESVTKDGRTFERRLADDLVLTGPDGSPVTRRARSLLLVRNVGHLMTTPAVRTLPDDAEVPEGILDAVITVLCARADALGTTSATPNSPVGSIYVVKPKLHGPEEVAFADELFGRVEDLLGLPRHTVKLGLMDEERRTTINLAECLRAARHRVAFINTGFLDRTGDEIHTSMHAGPMVRKGAMKATPWIAAYERHNVDVGLGCGLRGRAQIGKGMWAAPDLMADMLRDKVAHPLAGANVAWVPSPTAATLHATHYHRVDVAEVQRELADALATNGPRAGIDELLAIPVDPDGAWSADEIRAELDNNAQGILGYVVRWVDQGVGCSKVPDIHDIALMEDRATCRISSQHIANWLHHGVVTTEQVLDTMRRMAAVVDRQNADDPAYTPMAPGFDGHAFRAACDLVLRGTEQPSGYTEPILHARRLARKQQEEDSPA